MTPRLPAAVLLDPAKETTHWGDSADFDGDCIETILECAIGGDPSVADTHRLPKITREAGVPHFRFRQRVGTSGTPALPPGSPGSRFGKTLENGWLPQVRAFRLRIVLVPSFPTTFFSLSCQRLIAWCAAFLTSYAGPATRMECGLKSPHPANHDRRKPKIRTTMRCKPARWLMAFAVPCLPLAADEMKVPLSSIARGLEWRGVALEEMDFTLWEVSPIRADDGKVHLFVGRWPETNVDPAWRKSSEIAHYIGDGPEGPFRFHDVALQGSGRETWDKYAPCNPEVRRSERLAVGLKIPLAP